MVEPVARIRPFQTSDDKDVKFAIGKGSLESLAVANRKAYFHPLTLALWVLFSSIFIQVMGWWPNASGAHGFWSFLGPLPAFGSMAVPIMFFIDWMNRPFFEDATQELLKQPDMRDIHAHYTRSSASGFWILEYGDRLIGLIAIDASPESSPKDRQDKKGKGKDITSPIAILRHLYVDEPYRAIAMQKDLLDHAIKHTFISSVTVQSIKAADSPLISYIRLGLREAGFELRKNTKTVGLLGWKLGERVLERETWEKSLKS